MLTITDIKKKNKEIGSHFFDKDTMSFFNSKIKNKIYKEKYFITSEQFDHNSLRLYSIRIVEKNGRIDTFGRFQQFKNIEQCEGFIALNG